MHLILLAPFLASLSDSRHVSVMVGESYRLNWERSWKRGFFFLKFIVILCI